MVIEAPYSKHSKTNFKIAIAICIGLAIIFAYDGYCSKYEWSFRRRSFYEKHIKDGKLDSTMRFNRQAPLVLVPCAVILTAWFLQRKNKKLLADENALIIGQGSMVRGQGSGKQSLFPEIRIPYDNIQKIDKTHFGSKGYFIITYKNNLKLKTKNLKLSNRKYDKLEAILEHLVTKIT
jgi:hypothetical protein